MMTPKRQSTRPLTRQATGSSTVQPTGSSTRNANSQKKRNPKAHSTKQTQRKPKCFGNKIKSLKSYVSPKLKTNMRVGLIKALPYLLIAYAINKFTWLCYQTDGQTPILKVFNAMDDPLKAFLNPLPSLKQECLLAGLLVAAGLKLFMEIRKRNMKNTRPGAEHGSARWGNAKDAEHFIDPNIRNNLLLTRTERLRLNGYAESPAFERNKNVLIIGTTGSGKTRFYLKPQLMQMHSSYVITDPKGDIVLQCGKMLLDGGYDLKIVNLIDFSQSMKYNPFHYLRKEQDILNLVDVLIENTKGEGAQADQDFWVKAEKLYFTALISYMWYELPAEEQNFSTLIDMLDVSEVKANDPDYQNAIDCLFEELAEKNPDHFAVRQYKKYKLAAAETAQGILISCAARMSPFDLQAVRDLMSEDQLELDMIGDRKTALFIIIPDTSRTFNFIAAMMYSQMFNTLCEKALLVFGGKLPVHVRFLLDEFRNVGKIPYFDNLITTIRSRNMSANVIIQNLEQLKSMYKDNASSIISNCDSLLFLGGRDDALIKDLEEILGKETIEALSTSKNKGNSESFGTNSSKMGRSLMTKDEILTMPGDMCILYIRGVRPFYSQKFDITSHPRYKMLSDYNKQNELDARAYVSNYGKAKLDPDEEIAFVYEAEEETA